MHVIPGSHVRGPEIHFVRRDFQICDDRVAGTPCRTVELEPGGALLFDGMLWHGTPPNRTKDRRRALQFHYAPEWAVEGSEEDRLRHFGHEGTGATC